MSSFMANGGCLLPLIVVRTNGPIGRLISLLIAALLPGILNVPVAGRGAESDGIQHVESLPGIVHQRPDTVGQPIDTPGIWTGLSSDASYRGGHLLRTPGNFESSQNLGVAKLSIGAQNLDVFELISNHGGRSDARILDAVLAPAGSAMEPCFIAGREDAELVAFLDQDEVAMVAAQQPSRIEPNAAVLVNPRFLTRFNTRSPRIERVRDERVKCVGLPF